MMLQALVAFAEREGLMADRDFEKRRVDVEIRLDAAGRYLGSVILGDDGRGLEMVAPVLPQRTNPGYPAYLVDNVQYLLGAAKPSEKEGNAAKSARSYVDLVRAAADATGDSQLGSVLAFVTDEGERARALADIRAKHVARLGKAKDPAKARDKLEAALPGKMAVLYVGDSATPVHLSPAVSAWWRARRAATAAPASPAAERACLVTGRLGPIARTHDTIGNLPGGPGTGARLVSFNKENEAFGSHHLEQGDNAPISEHAAQAYVRAIDHMLERVGEGRDRRRQALVIAPDCAILVWTREANDAPEALLDLFAPTSTTEDDVLGTLASPWRGLAPADTDDSAFYACTLAPNRARVVVRSWIETTAGDVKRNLRRYFADLEIVGDPGEPLPITRLLRALEATPGAQGDKRGLSPTLASRLFASALCGTPFPRELLAASLARLRVPPREREWGGTLRARVALIKATLLRLRPPDGSHLEVSVSLDESSSSVPYLLGRLFAACERLQADALNDVGATIRDRYFGAASATPALVFPRLLRLSVHHASKAADNGKPWAEITKSRIVASLPAEPFPKLLGLEDQGLFAVGYYHQREAFFTKRADPSSDAAASESRKEGS